MYLLVYKVHASLPHILGIFLPTKPISTAEAVLVTMVVTTFTFGSRVGIGLSVGVVGGGTMH